MSGPPPDNTTGAAEWWARWSPHMGYEIAPGLVPECLNNTIIVFEKPGHHKENGRNCFQPGRGSFWLSEEEFQARMKSQETMLLKLRQKKD